MRSTCRLSSKKDGISLIFSLCITDSFVGNIPDKYLGFIPDKYLGF